MPGADLHANEIQALVLAGGRGTRLHSVTKGCNKHLIPFGQRTILTTNIAQLWRSGIRRFTIVTDTLLTERVRLLLDSETAVSSRDASIIATEDSGCPLGKVILNALPFIQAPRVLLFLGDNYFVGPWNAFADCISTACEHGPATVVLANGQDTQECGMPIFDNGRIVRFGTSTHYGGVAQADAHDLILTGVACYDAMLLRQVAAMLPAGLTLPDLSALNAMLLTHSQIDYVVWPHQWYDVGTPVGLKLALRACIRDAGETVPDYACILSAIGSPRAADAISSIYSEITNEPP